MTPFDRLAPFIREFIWRSGWNELRDVQVMAIDAILDSEDDVLIASGTASGKTEAAFFPMLTRLQADPADSFGILYIGPLKALINDQFERIEALLDEADCPVYAWHGDRPASEKARAQQSPRGVLQITPEALEGLLMRQSSEAKRLFADLRFIVIDELHAFTGTDRGLQLQCQLLRLDRLIGRSPRRVALSATISDYAASAEWLRAGTGREVCVIESKAGGRRLDLGLRHYAVVAAPALEEGLRALGQAAGKALAPSSPDVAGDGARPTQDPDGDALLRPLYDDLYRQCRGCKCLVFTNSRAETEQVTAALSARARALGEPDVFRAHHGSLSALLRHDAESAMKTAEGGAVTVTTRTLELGIDLGALDKVLQLGAPTSCASFVQRLGRSGRRGQSAVMRFFTHHRPGQAEFLMNLPWELLQTAAVCQLYLEERWVEPFEEKPLPFSVLFHQLLSTLMAGEQTPRALGRAVHGLPAFAAVPAEDYMALLRHMIDVDIVERTESGALLPGLAGEQLAADYRFLSVFRDESGYRVLHGQHVLGEVERVPQVGSVLAMAGRLWRVEALDEARRAVYVQPAVGDAGRLWIGSRGPGLHDRVVRRMRQVLTEDAVYPWLDAGGRAALEEARRRAASMALDQPIHRLDRAALRLLPWLGTRKLDTLVFLLRTLWARRLKVEGATLICGVAVHVHTSLDPEAFRAELIKALQTLRPEDVVPLAPAAPQDRYDAWVPEGLLQKAYVYNRLDIPGLKRAMLEALNTPDDNEVDV